MCSKTFFDASFFVTRLEKFTVSGNRCEQHGFQMFVIATFCLTKRDFFGKNRILRLILPFEDCNIF